MSNPTPSGTGMGCKYTPPSVSGAGTEREMGSRERGWGKQNSTPTHPVVMPIYFLMQMWDFQLWIYCNFRLVRAVPAARNISHARGTRTCPAGTGKRCGPGGKKFD